MATLFPTTVAPRGFVSTDTDLAAVDHWYDNLGCTTAFLAAIDELAFLTPSAFRESPVGGSDGCMATTLK